MFHYFKKFIFFFLFNKLNANGLGNKGLLFEQNLHEYLNFLIEISSMPKFGLSLSNKSNDILFQILFTKQLSVFTNILLRYHELRLGVGFVFEIKNFTWNMQFNLNLLLFSKQHTSIFIFYKTNIEKFKSSLPSSPSSSSCSIFPKTFISKETQTNDQLLSNQNSEFNNDAPNDNLSTNDNNKRNRNKVDFSISYLISDLSPNMFE